MRSSPATSTSVPSTPEIRRHPAIRGGAAVGRRGARQCLGTLGPVLLGPLLLVSLLGFTPVAEAAELAGVAMSDRAQAGESSLVLNGLGLRKRAIFKVYVAGLYLPAKRSDPAAILAADEARMLVMEFVRDVGKSSLTDAWNDCLANNSPDAPSEVKAGFEKLNGWMDDVSDGDRLAFTYVPGEGTSVTVRNRAAGRVAGKAFADALFACWIGDAPPSEDFKEGLLGR